MEIVDDAVVLVRFCLCKLSISHNVWLRSTKNHLVESTSDLNKSIKNIIMKLKHPKYKKYFGRELFCCWDDVRKIFLPHFGHPDYAQYLPLQKKVHFWNNIHIERCQFRPPIPEFRESESPAPSSKYRAFALLQLQLAGHQLQIQLKSMLLCVMRMFSLSLCFFYTS